jgi:lipopolysaccharide transport system ATP-binding protein
MNDADVLVECKGVSKKFARTLKKSMLYGFNDISSAMLGKQGVRKLRPDEFWAVKDVNFQLKRGECLGLIGHNGAGKSTLLKILNGLTRPDEGEVIVRGRVGALIELGAGFNPILSGRENVYINGQILGFTKQEIDDKLDAIIEFSEIGEFIDTPVQNYSSGMKVRLGFAVAAQMEPDVLIIDEVLAVGDLKFVLKCFNRIEEIIKKCSVIFVSHNLPQVSRICDKALLLGKGRIISTTDEVSEVIDQYYTSHDTKIGNFHNSEVSSITIGKIMVNSQASTSVDMPVVKRLDDLELTFEIIPDKGGLQLIPSLSFYNKELRNIAECKPENVWIDTKENSPTTFSIKLDRIQFAKGIYTVTLGLVNKDDNQVVYRGQSICGFQVKSKRLFWTSFELEGQLIVHKL